MKRLMTYLADSLEIMCDWQHMLPGWLDDYFQGVWILLFGQHCILFQLALKIDRKYKVWTWTGSRKVLYPNYPGPAK